MNCDHLSTRYFYAVLMACFAVGCGEKIRQEPPKSTTGTGAPAEKPAKSADGKLKRLIFLTNNSAPFWDAVRAGVDDANKDLDLASAGFTAVIDINDGKLESQIDKLRRYATESDVAGVAISVIRADNVAIVDELRNLKKKGIPVVTVDADIDRETARDARVAFIGTDNLKGGKVLGQCAKMLRPDGGDYVAFFGEASSQNVVERTGGFADGAGDAFNKKDLMADGVDLAKARENVRNAIRNHPDLKVLVGIWSYNAPAIVDVAVNELKRRDDFTIVTFDAEAGAIEAMGQGGIDAMVVQNPYAMGHDSMKLLKALNQKDDATVKEMLPKLGEPDGDLYDTGLKVVVPNAESPVKKEEFPANVQYLTLKEFQEWLAKYGLSGS